MEKIVGLEDYCVALEDSTKSAINQLFLSSIVNGETEVSHIKF